MPGSGTSIFTDPDGYQASLPQTVNLLLVRPGEFRARLTQVELPHISVIRASETASRVAYFMLPPELVVITFPTLATSRLICGGRELQLGELVWHACGERFHQRTTAASSWGRISLRPRSLQTFARALTGGDLIFPDFGRTFRPREVDRTQLHRLHHQACRLAETKLDNVGHPEVSRALEEDLASTLVMCLSNGEPQAEWRENRQAVESLIQFEEMLAASGGNPPTLKEICRSLRLPERRLRVFSWRILGMGPGQYLWLRRRRARQQGRPHWR